jgi:hypothetical protein
MPFQKGVSGNPGGKSKIPKEVQTLAREYTADAIKALVTALKEPNERVKAADILLERGWGKVTQPHSGPDDGPLEVIHRIERAIVRPPHRDG